MIDPESKSPKILGTASEADFTQTPRQRILPPSIVGRCLSYDGGNIDGRTAHQVIIDNVIAGETEARRQIGRSIIG